MAGLLGGSVTPVERLVHAVRILLNTLRLDPSFSCSRPSLEPWRALEEALQAYELELEQRQK